MESLELAVEDEDAIESAGEEVQRKKLYLVESDPATVYQQRTGLSLYSAGTSRKDGPYFVRW